MSALVSESGIAPLSLAEARDWLRLGPGDDDAAVAGLIRAATSLCEAFTGRMLIIRSVTEERWAKAGWLQLARQPVATVDAVLHLPNGGTPQLIPTTDWTVQRLAEGAAALKLAGIAPGERVQITYRAGIAADANDVPEALRQGMLRLVQHWHFSRQEDAPMPAIVTALWTPWRRLSLGSQP